MVRALLLDPSIRDWVLLPITLVMFASGILRHYISKLSTSAPTAAKDIEPVAKRQVLARAARFRNNADVLPESAFLARKHYWTAKDSGALHVDEQTDQGPAAPPMPMMDPNQSTAMMTRQLTMVVPQMLMMAWINHFFSGFVLIRLPFPLTVRFKGMMQRGIDLAFLDTSYVSSLSWYFINVFGLRGVFSLVLGEANNADDAKMMQQQMSAGAGMGAGQAPDFRKMYTAEKENIVLVHHDASCIADASSRLAKTLSSTPSSSTSSTFKED